MKNTLHRLHIQAQTTTIDPLSIMDKSDIKKGKKYKAFVLAHEGITKPRDIHQGNIVLKWGRQAVLSIKDALLKGVKFFKGHNADSSTINRTPIGQVVSAAFKTLKNKLHYVVVGEFEKDNTDDVVSMEADILTDNNNNVVGVKSITGIAAASATEFKPAFEGATLMGSMQFF